jgi:hypothetical protein
MIGLGCERERITSPTVEPMATAKAIRMGGLTQPQSDPFTMAATTLATATDSSPAPTRSALWAAGSFTSFSTRRPMMRARRAKGRLTRKTQRQLAWTRRPPMGGPRAAAAPPTADHSPMAAPLRSGPKAGRSRPSEVGSMRAPPLAWRMRAAMSRPRVGLSAQRADDAVKMPNPMRKARLRPARSAQRPAGTSRAANTMV